MNEILRSLDTKRQCIVRLLRAFLGNLQRVRVMLLKNGNYEVAAVENMKLDHVDVGE